jgi:uncharacterized phage protein gp47/JayE
MADTPVCTIDANGIHKPSFSDCLEYFQGLFRSIYGSDIYIDNDSQDGQLIGVLALALDDANTMTVAAYNSFSPSTAQGVGLSSNVKLNGIKRQIPSRSTVDVIVIGVAGTIIAEGSAISDGNQNLWTLPETVIPSEGETMVTATALLEGAIFAGPFALSTIVTVTRGWQQVYNPGTATLGAPVETDVQLRRRQTYSASLPALGPRRGLQAALADLSGSRRLRVYENSNPGPDEWGVPGYSIAVVTDSGGARQIVEAIALKKGSGVRTYGTHSLLTLPDDHDFSTRIYFSPVVNVPITYRLQIKSGVGFTTDVLRRVTENLATWTQGLGIGTNVQLADAYMAARLYGAAESATYKIVPGSLMVARDSMEFATQDIAIVYNEAPYAEPSYVYVEVT